MTMTKKATTKAPARVCAWVVDVRDRDGIWGWARVAAPDEPRALSAAIVALHDLDGGPHMGTLTLSAPRLHFISPSNEETRATS